MKPDDHDGVRAAAGGVSSDGGTIWAPGADPESAGSGTPAAEPPRYLDHGELATGGMSAIHLVTDARFDRQLALKRLKPHLADQAHKRALLQREARVTAHLEHPGIVPVHDVGTDDLGRVWFTMKRVAGRTFYDVYRPAHDLRALVEVIVRLCDAVAFAHSKGVLHCDIKPTNVMLGTFGEVYLMDWGIAVGVDEGLCPVGTPAWHAPEQALSAGVDVRTDVYGLGALLYVGLCGALVHPGNSAAARREHARTQHVTPPQQIVPGLPAELCRITLRALAYAREDRYPDTTSLKADLVEALRGGWWLETRSWPAGSVVVREGDTADAAWIIVEGTARVSQGGNVVTRLGPGDTFGEVALLCRERRTATVVAETPLVTRVLTAAALESALNDVWLGPIARSLARRLLERERALR